MCSRCNYIYLKLTNNIQLSWPETKTGSDNKQLNLYIQAQVLLLSFQCPKITVKSSYSISSVCVSHPSKAISRRCLPADTHRSQSGMFWETGCGWWPVPARQLHRMLTAWAQHGANRCTDTTALRLTWSFSLTSCYTANTHGVRTRQDEEGVALLLAGWTAGELLQTIYHFFLIFLPAWLPCFHSQKLPAFSLLMEGPRWHYWHFSQCLELDLIIFPSRELGQQRKSMAKHLSTDTW